MKKTLPYTGAAKRGILIVALIVASSTELLAQGTAPGSKPSTCCKPLSPAP